MLKRLPWLWIMLITVLHAEDDFRLPALPMPALVEEDGEVKQVGSMKLLRQLFKSGLRGFEGFQTTDRDYAVMRSDSLVSLAAWLEATCRELDYDLRTARTRNYQGTVFARLLNTSTSLAQLRGRYTEGPAMPIGSVICPRIKAWGALPADSAEDSYVIFATDQGLMIYDPPTQQICALADFPNRDSIIQIRF